MNKFKICLILGLVCLFALNVSATERRRNNRNSNRSFKDSLDDEYQAVCTSADRKSNCMSNTPMEGCLCYNNGTCIDTMIDRCRDCNNEEVFSVKYGQCPRTQSYLCQPPVPGVKYTCVQATYDSCVCSLNGTCHEQKASHCVDCQNANILAVFENKTCPAQFLQTPPSKFFIPKKCDKSGARSISCLRTQTPGCACYANGTCEYRTDSNRCLLCFDKNVMSFNQGQYCPAARNSKVYSCDKEASKNCKSNWNKNSCVCKEDGTCNTMKTNHCKACKSWDVVSVVESNQCPVASYVGLQSAKAHFKPEKKAQSNYNNNKNSNNNKYNNNNRYNNNGYRSRSVEEV